MKQIIPFSKEIVFKSKIASITSISLEHEEKVFDGEISGDFIVFGEYKEHNDTTETELFKYRLPFTALIPDNLEKDTIKIDIEDFTYNQVEDDVLNVIIDFCLSGEESKQEERCDKEVNEELKSEDEVILDDNVIDGSKELEMLEKEQIDDEKLNRDIDELLGLNENNIKQNDLNILDKKDIVKEETSNIEITKSEETNVEEKSEYVTYHIHIVKENETIEQVMSLYGTNIDNLKQYNDIEKIKVGDKLIIPEYVDE